MAHDQHATADVPKELLARHQEGWSAFTRATTLSCVAIAGILILMLVFLRIL
jgi:hypothetical protein